MLSAMGTEPREKMRGPRERGDDSWKEVGAWDGGQMQEAHCPVGPKRQKQGRRMKPSQIERRMDGVGCTDHKGRSHF